MTMSFWGVGGLTQQSIAQQSLNERHDKCFLPNQWQEALWTLDSAIVTVGVSVYDLEAQALVDLQGAFISTKCNLLC